MKGTFITIFLLTSLMTISPQTIFADVCVISEMEISKVTGNVIDPNKYAIPKAKIQLRKRKSEKTIQEKEANDSGWFEFSNISKGKYTLVVSFPNTRTLYIPIKVIKNKNLNSSYLEITVDYTIGGCDEKVNVLEKSY